MITARLHATRDFDVEPIILELEIAPTELVIPDPLGIDVVYVLRSRFMPAATSTDKATADYVFDHLA